MTMRKLFPMLDTLASGSGSQQIRNDQGSFNNPNRQAQVLQVGTILAVNSVSGAVISVDGVSIDATQATDEPLRAGDQCWVSKSKEGIYVIHGSKK